MIKNPHRTRPNIACDELRVIRGSCWISHASEKSVSSRKIWTFMGSDKRGGTAKGRFAWIRDDFYSENGFRVATKAVRK